MIRKPVLNITSVVIIIAILVVSLTLFLINPKEIESACIGKTPVNAFKTPNGSFQCVKYSVSCQSKNDNSIYFNVKYENNCDKNVSVYLIQADSQKKYTDIHLATIKESLPSCYPSKLLPHQASEERYMITTENKTLPELSLNDLYIDYENIWETTNDCENISRIIENSRLILAAPPDKNGQPNIFYKWK
jgi:hypothetical protein